jgi:hypothetical protein
MKARILLICCVVAPARYLRALRRLPASEHPRHEEM